MSVGKVTLTDALNTSCFRSLVLLPICGRSGVVTSHVQFQSLRTLF